MGNDDERKRSFCQFFYKLPCNNAIVSCQLRGRMKCGSCMRRPPSSVQSSSTRKLLHRLKTHWLTKTGHELCCMFRAPSCVYWLVLRFMCLGRVALTSWKGTRPLKKGFYTPWKSLLAFWSLPILSLESYRFGFSVLQSLIAGMMPSEMISSRIFSRCA